MTKEEFRKKLFELLCECKFIDNEDWAGTDEAIKTLEHWGIEFKKEYNVVVVGELKKDPNENIKFDWAL